MLMLLLLLVNRLRWKIISCLFYPVLVLNESMVSIIFIKVGPQSVHEVMSLLLTQENRIESKLSSTYGSLPFVNLMVQSKPNDPKMQKTNSNQFSSNNGSGNRGRGGGRGGSNFNRGGRGSPWNNRNRP